MNILPPILNSRNGVQKKEKKKKKDENKEESGIKLISGDCRIKLSTHLVVDFVEGVLQLPMDSSQLFEVSVGFVDGQQNLVHFIYGLVHGSLGVTAKWKGSFTHTIRSHNTPSAVVTLCCVNMQSVTMWLENVSRTMLKEAAACSRRPTRPDSLKYFPAQIPSSSGDRTSSDTADSSNTLDEIF